MQVEVTDLATGKMWYFAADCWLDASQGDKATQRLLLASDSDPWADMTTWKVSCYCREHPVTGGVLAYSLCVWLCKTHASWRLDGPHMQNKSCMFVHNSVIVTTAH